MGETVKVSLILIGCTLLLCNVASLIADVPLWALAIVDAIIGTTVALTLFIWSRFTEPGQTEGFRAQGLDAGEEPGKRKRISRALVYAVVAVGSFGIGLQGFFVPEMGGGRDSGISGILLAAALGFLAFREYRGSRREPDLSPDSNPLAALNAAPARTALEKSTPIGSPTALVVIVGFVMLLVIADVRKILMPSGPNDVWVGVGQMVIWVPILGYLAYRECRRIREKRKQPGQSADDC